MTGRFRLLLPALLLLAACSSERQLTSCTTLVFGTLVELTLYGVDTDTGRAVCAETEQQLRQWQRLG